jgi:uncharacterized protein YciI
MHFIGIGTNGDREKFAPFLEEEGRVLADLREQGTIKTVFRRVDGSGVISILEAATHADAVEQLNRLPLVREGLLSVELVEVTEL